MSTEITGSAFPDKASDQLAPSKTKQNYGANNFNGASSDLPGQRTITDLGAEMARKSEGSERVADIVRTRGIGKSDDPASFKTHLEHEHPVPYAFGHKRRGSLDEQVPNKVAGSSGEPVRTPTR